MSHGSSHFLYLGSKIGGLKDLAIFTVPLSNRIIKQDLSVVLFRSILSSMSETLLPFDKCQ